MVQFHVLSFEGPDGYARAGGIASRITGLTRALADAGLETHLWFVGDPSLPGHEQAENLHLHRWCQWLSQQHHRGVYDGEAAKADDYAASLPPFLLQNHLLAALQRGERVVVLAEEWHTVHAVLHLDWLLRQANLRDQVDILWNANNTFGFDGIDWPALDRAATITTVSRYMKHLMRPLGIDPLVIPNGIESEAFIEPDAEAAARMKQQTRGRELLVKMARFDPDKRWLLAIDTVRELKQHGRRPLLIARGGVEAHGREIQSRVRDHDLRFAERYLSGSDAGSVLGAVEDTSELDIVFLTSHVGPEARRVLFRSASAVLANSGHEPFGLVGLEVMAASGVACTGCSGEDYAVPGQNALVLETEEPSEFIQLFGRLGEAGEQQLRRSGRHTSLQFAWERVIERVLLPRLSVHLPASVRVISPPTRRTRCSPSPLQYAVT